MGAKLFVHTGLCLRAKRSSLQEVGAVLNQVNILFGFVWKFKSQTRDLMRNIDVGLRACEYVEANCRLDSLFSERTARPCKKTTTCRTYVVGTIWWIDVSVHKDRYSAKPVTHVYAVAIYMRSLFVVSARDEGFLLHTLSMMTDCGKWSFRRDLKIALCTRTGSKNS